LSVPEEGMATDELAVGLSKVHNSIGVCEGERITTRYHL
jgi:hypothetical protein